MTTQKQAKPVIRAMDLGFGFVKHEKLNQETNEMEYSSFPSLAPKASNIDMSAGVLGKRNTTIVHVDGTKYEVGPDSTDLESSDVIRALNDNYIFTDQYKALTLGAFFYMNEPVIDLLVVGLPVSNLNQSEDLKKMLIGKHQVNDEFSTEVKNVLVLAQPIGGLYYCMNVLKNEEFEDLKNERNLIIDPGFQTYDFVLSNGERIIESKSDAKPGGVSKVLESIAKSISDEKGIKYTNLNAIDKGLRKKERIIKISGKKESLDKHIKNTKGALESSIMYMLNVLGSDCSDIDNIIMVGGGAHIFEKAIRKQKQFEDREIHVVDNPQFAILMGYHAAGEELYPSIPQVNL